jgi:ABC-type multidrug transport system ATPase subunit
MTSITADHVTKSFGDSPVLQDISVTISSGELFFYLGLQAAGKLLF